MGTILKNIVDFDELEIGVPVALPHRLNINGQPVAPKLVAADRGGFEIDANATNVTVTRTIDGSDEVNVYVEYWHTIEDVTPLTPPPGKLFGQTPFIINGGGGGSGPQIARGVFNGDNGATINSAGCTCTRNSAGNYTVTFDPPFSDTCAPVASIAEDVGAVQFQITVSDIGSDQCTVLIYSNDDGFVPTDADFSIVAVASVSAP